MNFPAKPFCIGAMAALLTSGAVQAQEACSTHVVVAGDNLRSIARSAFGDADLYRVIYKANTQVIGKKADLILIGAELVIPCSPNGELPVAGAAASESEVVAAEEALNPISIPLATGVIDPAKQPVEILPELPFVIVGAPLTEAEPIAEAVAEPVVEEVVEAEPEPTPEPVPEAEPVDVVEAPPVVPEVEPVPETAAEEAVAEVEVPAEEPVLEAAPEPVAEAPAEVVVAAAEPVATVPATGDAQPFRLLTGNYYAPFADEMLPGGGMVTQLVEMAIFRADPAIPYNLTFINDWQAHIDALLPSQAYDLSFPWVRPDCEGDVMLSAGDLSRCENFEFSAPLYEIVDGYFANADSALVAATSYTAFEGTRICRPEGYTTGVLDAAGLSVPKIELLRPASVVDCFEALEAGKVDLVSIDAEVGDSAIAELGLVGEFAQNPHLTTFLSLHVIAHKSNARAVAMIQQLNSGIAEMYESGEWYDIVSSTLSQSALRQ